MILAVKIQLRIGNVEGAAPAERDSFHPVATRIQQVHRLFANLAVLVAASRNRSRP
jgi:hypothetical protein